MTNHPEGPEALTAKHRAATLDALGQDGAVLPGDVDQFLAKIAAHEIDVPAEALRTQYVAATMSRLFLPSVIEVRQAAADLSVTDGEFTIHGESPAYTKVLADYMAPFRLAPDAGLSPHTPGLSLGTTPRFLDGRDGVDDAYLSLPSTNGSVLAREWPDDANMFDVPLLWDPTEYSLDSFSAIEDEQIDDYPAAMREWWHIIHRHNPAQQPTPRVMRGIGLLPVPPLEERLPTDTFPYEVDFVPQIARAPADADIDRIYDARLLLKGNDTLGGGLYRLNSDTDKKPIFNDYEGWEEPLIVNRIDHTPAEERAGGRISNPLGTIALYILAHRHEGGQAIPDPDVQPLVVSLQLRTLEHI